MSAQSVAKISLVQDEPSAESGVDPQVGVTVDDANDGLTVTVSPRVLSLLPGSYTLTWTLTQNPGVASWSIDSINGIPAVLDPRGNWTCPWTNDLTSGQTAEVYAYTIGLTKTFLDPRVTANITIDPVIENDPPPNGVDTGAGQAG